jgi:two-component system alkaline phosphatase synthesis response regulator PhoP
MVKMKRILIIEDSPNIVMVERLCLKANGYEVLTAVDGLQGLAMAISEHPDLILLDLLLPKLDGYLFLKALHENPAIAAIPVLVTSAKAQVDDLEQAHTYKISGYLVKPFTPTELLAKIAQIQNKEAKNYE